jgi:hydrogenase-1 operon protein HyaF
MSSFPFSSRVFPVPIVVDELPATGDNAPEYLPMPHDMAVFSAPRIPEETDQTLLLAVAQRLRSVLAAMQATDFAYATDVQEDLCGWPADERALAGDLLGFGEVSAYALQEGICWRVQETAFPGLWRVLALAGNDPHDKAAPLLEDFLQAGAIPPVLADTMRASGLTTIPPPDFPADVMNAPSLVHEITMRARNWQEGSRTEILNFTLLPVTGADLEVLYGWLGHREVSILSRGYGNCRLSSTFLNNVWWVQYFNSMDTLILNTLEITAMPEAALAAREDYEDTLARLDAYLQTLISPAGN